MATGSQSQNFVAIQEIRDGIVILKNGGLRGVLLVSAMNLALKSSQEQEATFSQFQGFLNTLDFSVEIVVQSRRMDIRPYLQILDQRLIMQKEELLRIQNKMYIEYIKKFTEDVEIMRKYFFIVVPYSVSVESSSKKSGIDKVLDSFRGNKQKAKKSNLTSTEEQFEQKRMQLEERLSVVSQGLSSVGLKAEFVGTEALVDVFYSLYNPGDTQKSITSVPV